MLSDATIMVIGYIAGEPKLSQPKPDASLLVLTVAVNRWNGKANDTLWCRVELWAPRPELVSKMRNGAYVRVVGSLYPSRWNGRDGTAHDGFVIRYPSVLVLDPGKKTAGAGSSSSAESDEGSSGESAEHIF